MTPHFMVLKLGRQEGRKRCERSIPDFLPSLLIILHSMVLK
jgi:hypothetical protein